MATTIPVTDPSVYADFAGLDSLKRAAHDHDPQALKAVAKQFESLFARMMLKSMRDAVGPDPIFGSDQEKMYQGMFDDQLSVELTRGRGLGLADMLIRQLQRMGVSGSGAVDGADGAKTGAAGSGATATGAAQATGTPNAARSAASSATRSAFVRSVWPHAAQAARELGVSPTTLVAQAALETNWGQDVPCDTSGRSSHNLFGIKTGAGWSGSNVSAATQEFTNGAPSETTSNFRAYDNPAQCFEDYVALLRGNPRYAAALGTGGNVQAFASALQRGGYATDPDYARKVTAVAASVAGLRAASPAARDTAAPSRALKFAGARPMTVSKRTL